MADPRRWMMLLAAAWLGMLLTVAAIATPAPFATLPRHDAGRVVARVLAHEAAASLLLGGLLLGLQRVAKRRHETGRAPAAQFDAPLTLTAGAVFCTVAGYYAIVPMMDAARAGPWPLSFGQLHLISAAFFALKMLCVAALAWRLSRQPAVSG